MDFGTVSPPPGVSRFSGGQLSGFATFFNVILKTMIVGAGIYALINLVIAGYQFLSAAGDPKRIGDAWAKIWHSVLGLTITAGAFVLAALIGYLLFRDPNALLQLRVFGP